MRESRHNWLRLRRAEHPSRRRQAMTSLLAGLLLLVIIPSTCLAEDLLCFPKGEAPAIVMALETGNVLKIENELQMQELENLKAQNEERERTVTLLNQQIEAYKNLLELEKAGREQDKQIAAAELKEAKKWPVKTALISFGVGFVTAIVTLVALGI